MQKRRLFAGRALKQIRATRGMRQGQMAVVLGISGAYLSQLENDDRPLTGTLIGKLRAEFPIEWRDILQSDSLPLHDALYEAATGPLTGADIPSSQVRRVAEQFPEFARKFIAIERLNRNVQQQLAMLDEAIGTDQPTGGRLPWEEVRDWFHNTNNYVDTIDRAAEELATELAESQMAPTLPELAGWLERHEVALEFASDCGLRAFFEERRVLQLGKDQQSESLRFQLASQIASMALQSQIADIINHSSLRTETARNLLAVGLVNYAAAAITLPYQRFRAAALEVRHDIDRLRWTFESSFEQICHRLSTLQRPGARGVPMFFCKVDMAGNITKRHSATGLQFARFGGGCPLWAVHEAVALPGKVLVQLAEMPDGVRYVSIAYGVIKSTRSWDSTARRYALALGCEAAFAKDFVYSDGLEIEDGRGDPIGTSCRICPRMGCDQRAYPPNDRDIVVDQASRGLLPYRIKIASTESEAIPQSPKQ